MDIIRIIFAVLLPPLGVFLQVGFGLQFWLNILLTLLGYIPGIIHAVIGLIPGVGDVASTAMAAWVVAEAARLGAPKRLLARMGLNVAIDFLLGAVPLVGDLADIAFKANLRNVDLLERHLSRTG